MTAPLHAAVMARVAAAPDAVALRVPGAVLDYAAFGARVDAAVGHLVALGVGRGDRVGVLAYNAPGTLALLFACARIGALLLPLNWRLARAELAWMLADAGPRVLFVDADHRGDWPEGVDLAVLDSAVAAQALPEGPGGEVPVLLVYTSGTTGRPKGAVLSQAALLANAALSRDMHGLRAADHVLTVLPLFHVGGLNIQTVPALLTGASVTLHPRFEPGAALAAIAAGRPTLTVLVPATLQALYAQPGWAGADVSSLRAVTTGSTVVAPAVMTPFLARGVPVLQVYGSTETAPIALYTRVGGEYALTSTGHAGPGCDVRAVDAAGAVVAPGVAGEICLRGKQLFQGYWRNPAATAEAVRDGWFHTGDIGTQAADGSWTVHDRRKNLIISGGENIYPAEIERVLHEIPAVAEAAVIGVPDARWQAVPEAHVVLRPGMRCSEAEIIAHVRGELARFKAPRRVHFRDALPRNAMGKVLVEQLREAEAAA